jgi:glycosyltransferase involved in cell wall biosynthesis
MNRTVNSMTTISVVIPTYNRANTILDAVTSVLGQSRAADEVIVIDDGSTDETASLLEPFASKIRLFTQSNAGVAAARNRGIRESKGEWITFLDSDDVWFADRLELLHRDLGALDFTVHVSDTLFTGDGYRENFFSIIDFSAPKGRACVVTDPFGLARSCPPLDSIAVRRDAFEQTGVFDESMSIAEDLHLLCRLGVSQPWAATGDLAANARRVEGEPGLSRRSIVDSVLGALAGVKVYDDLATSGLLATRFKSELLRSQSAATFKLSKTQYDAGYYWSSRRSLLRSAVRHPSAKGWVKVVPPLILGGLGYRLVIGRKTGFRR